MVTKEAVAIQQPEAALPEGVVGIRFVMLGVEPAYAAQIGHHRNAYKLRVKTQMNHQLVTDREALT